MEEAQFEVLTDSQQTASIRIRPLTALEVRSRNAKSNNVIANSMLDGSMPLYPAFNNLLVRDPTTLQYANEGYSRNSLIFNIFTRRAQAIHQAKLLVYEKDSDGNPGTPLPNSDYQKLLRRPNPYMTARVFWQNSELYVCAGGATFVNKVRDEYGVVQYLYPYHSSQVNYIQGSNSWVTGYVYDNGAGYRREFTREDMFEIKFSSVNFFYPFKAISPLLSLLKEVNVDNQRGELEVALLQNGGVPAFAIYPGEDTQVMTQDQIDTSMEKIITKINGRNRGRPLLMSKDYKIEKMGMSPKDMLLTDFALIPETRACLLPGTGVITKRGIVAIENVIAGDYVIGHSGLWREVKEALRNPNRPCVEVSSGFTKLCATADHPVFAARISQNRSHKCSIDELRWSGAGELRPAKIRGECDGMFIPKLRPGNEKALDIFPLLKQGRMKFRRDANSITHSLPFVGKIPAKIPFTYRFGRLFGLYLAEGSCSASRIFFDFNKKEKEYHSEVRESLRDIFGLEAKFNEARTSMRITCSNPGLAQLFNCGNAHTKRLPEWAWGASAEFWKGMLDGWNDGDGHTVIKTNRVRVTTVSRNLAWHMRLIAIALGKKAGMDARVRPSGFIEGRPTPEGISYTIQYQANDNPRYSKFIPHEDGLVSKVTNVRAIDYDGPVYNLEVETDNSFLTESGIVHNCAVYGVPAGYAQTLTGLDKAGTFANRETDKRAMFEDTIVPCWHAYAEDINFAMEDEVFHDGIRGGDCIVAFDYSKLPALMESNDKVLDSAVKLWQANVLTLNTMLAKIGEDTLPDSDPRGDMYYTEFTGELSDLAAPVQTQPTVTEPTNEKPEDDNEED